MARLVLIQAVGIQDFIFATNRQKQNVGASELIHRIGTAFVVSAVAREVAAYKALADDLVRPMGAADYVTALACIAQKNPLGPNVPAEVLVATSGKAVLLVNEPATGERIIKYVTWRALQEAPGAMVHGAVDAEPIDFDGMDPGGAADVQARMRHMHRAIENLRVRLPAPEGRFPTSPITAPCATSGLPAEWRERDGELLCEPAYRKREASRAGWSRVEASLRGYRFAKHVDRLEDMDLPWLAVVHADGNGFGELFLNLGNHIPDDRPTTARGYCDLYRDLSLALELAGVKALADAMATLTPKPVRIDDRVEKFLPLVPLVFGGDDLTVICDGAQAVTFAEAYLKAFEAATSRSTIEIGTIGFVSALPSLTDLGKKGSKKFGAAAGVSIVKSHHPFHRAYGLAESLLKSAKTVKARLGPGCSALDFQVVFADASGDRDTVRDGWIFKERDGKTVLTARPYVATPEDQWDSRTGNVESDARKWARRRSLSRLYAGCRALERREPIEPEKEPRGLPRTQQHDLREALFLGTGTAKARLKLIKHRYEREVTWEAVLDEDDLYFEEKENDGEGEQTVRCTRYLDMLELIDVSAEGAFSEQVHGGAT